MRKNIWAFGLAITLFTASGVTTYAAPGATVSFTEGNTLEYGGGAEVKDGEMNLGSAFENVAPGETKEQVITIKNENNHTADFYLSAEAVKELEKGKATAKGAGYDIVLKAGDSVLYDSTVGGYNAGKNASTTGIAGMNGALEDYILFATLKKGESANVVLSIKFDGEAMDNTSAIDYSSTMGKIAFDFLAGYEDPTGKVVIVREVTEDGGVRYVRKVVEILENGVPLGAAATGDGAMIGIATVVLVAGVVLIGIGKKRKVGEKA